MAKDSPPFHELHARSAFSFLRGAASPEVMMRQASKLGMSHLVITDRDGVYGSARAHHEARALGIRAVVGAELTLECGGVLPVIVRTREGYQNLCRMLTQAKLAAAKGQSRITWDNLTTHARGLSALSGDHEGVLHRALDMGDKQKVVTLMQRLCQTFGSEHVFLEIHRRRLRHEDIRLSAIRDLAEHLSLPLVASNAPLYAAQEQRILQDAFTCLRHHTYLDAAGLHLAPNAEACLKSADQMQSLFADIPQALAETARVIESVEFGLENLGYEFPSHDVPAGHDQDSFLRERTFIGARERYPGNQLTPKVRAQLEKELALISKLGFSGYFLVVWDIVRWTKENGILVQGRGSAANSAVCYSLNITNVEPVGNSLLFERFLAEGRESWPDIDLDLPSGDQRERVIQEMYRRFAPYGAAMTANVITYRGRSAMREMGKVLNLPQDVIERFTDLYANGDFPHTLKLEEQVKQAGLPNEHPRLRPFLSLYSMVYGLPRHLGQHSGGMVLCTKGLDGIVPLEPASMPGRVVVQWDKDDCEDLGIIKVDFLGLGMMAVIEEAVHTSERRGHPVPLHTFPCNDPACYDLMQKADTIGVFQIESRAQMATLPRMKPENFYDLVVEVAIIRPGPIVGKMVHPYLSRRKDPSKIEYIDPEFEPILKRTLGVPLFQEQMLKMAMVIADFSGSEAEELRRAMSFHRSEERMDKAMAKLTAAMNRKNVKEEVQQRIKDSIKSFALYGFPESHAISFAQLAFTSVWLKVHRPAEFYAALLNCQPMGFYSCATLVRDAKQHGLRILPVCVCQSDETCTVVEDKILRLGFRQLRGFSSAAAQHLLHQRAVRPWQDLTDLLSRCQLSQRDKRVLAQAGAFNALGHHRRSALWESAVPLHQDLVESATTSEASPLSAMSDYERLAADYAVTGLTVGKHPMALIRDQLRRVVKASELSLHKNRSRLAIAGMVICRQRPGTANGHCFISLEDESGISNAFVPSRLFESSRLVITQEKFLKIHGELQHQEGVITVLAHRITSLRYDQLKQARLESHDFR
ncbi:DNA polymerase III subunit alpha [Brevifollis gellanilyticus]|uniref:DNA-directed DNA polymerase n=1 Tax=Brevifollis gellanilyticus TaxID=748831 RepID=A0A512M7B1_9BACT|nr:error-prone DNA polymerase [Brevifollis gellanilyticus]GEP42619.1 error-prone DNA polymerase [Brevifollis gellanilyticus]